MKPNVTIIFIAFILTGCGGGEDQATISAPAHPSPKSYVIDYYGDSTIWGSMAFHTGTQVQDNPPKILQQELTRRCGFPVAVNNLAVPGTYASQLLYGTSEYGNKPFSVRMAASSANLVIPGGYGMNDANGYADPPSYTAHMTELVKIALGAGKRVMLETPNRAIMNGYVPQSIVDSIPKYADAMKQVGATFGVPVIDQFTPYAGTPDQFPDGVHPSESIYIDKAMRMANALKPIVCP